MPMNRFDLDEHLRIDRTEDVLALPLVLDQSGAAQFLEVVRHGRERQVELPGDLRDAVAKFVGRVAGVPLTQWRP